MRSKAKIAVPLLLQEFISDMSGPDAIILWEWLHTEPTAARTAIKEALEERFQEWYR